MRIISIADLQQFSFFQRFSLKQLSQLLSHVKRETFRTDTFLDPEKVFFLIEKGCIEVLKRKRGSDKLHVLSFLKEGDVFGEGVRSGSLPYFASARVATETQVLILPLEALSSFECFVNKSR